MIGSSFFDAKFCYSRGHRRAAVNYREWRWHNGLFICFAVRRSGNFLSFHGLQSCDSGFHGTSNVLAFYQGGVSACRLTLWKSRFALDASEALLKE